MALAMAMARAMSQGPGLQGKPWPRQASASMPGAGPYLLVDIAVKAALTTIDKITALKACNS